MATPDDLLGRRHVYCFGDADDDRMFIEIKSRYLISEKAVKT